MRKKLKPEDQYVPLNSLVILFTGADYGGMMAPTYDFTTFSKKHFEFRKICDSGPLPYSANAETLRYTDDPKKDTCNILLE